MTSDELGMGSLQMRRLISGAPSAWGRRSIGMGSSRYSPIDTSVSMFMPSIFSMAGSIISPSMSSTRLLL